jgi:hypothetical protein
MHVISFHRSRGGKREIIVELPHTAAYGFFGSQYRNPN